MISEEELFLFPKQTIIEQLAFFIKGKNVDGFCTWEDLLKTEGLLPTDIVTGFSAREEESNDYEYIPCVVVNREREETDEEYQRRLNFKKEWEQTTKEIEYKTFLLLKEKLENDEEFANYRKLREAAKKEE